MLQCHKPGPRHLNPCRLPESRLAGLPWALVSPQASSSWALLSEAHSPWQKLRNSQDKPCLLWNRALSRAPILCSSFCFPLTKKKILSGFFFLNEWGEYIWFHWVFPRLCCFCTSPVLTPNFSPPATISPALRRIFVCIFGCVPLLPCGMRVFLMYPLMSRYQCMLIITKADVSRYSYSRVNIHKPIDGSGFPHMPTWSGSLQQGG